MSVNGITNQVAAYTTMPSKPAKTEKPAAEAAATATKTSDAADKGVIYEPSNDATNAAVTKAKKYTPNAELVAQLKADADARVSQMRSLVEKMMMGQGNAIGTADDMWSFLRTGKFTVDAATKAQAQADIAEDGYWGVKQTSDRILDFAKALTGGDPDKIESMRSAFEKGYKQAEKTWGGKLPEISEKTNSAVMDKFDQWAAESKKVQDATTVQP